MKYDILMEVLLSGKTPRGGITYLHQVHTCGTAACILDVCAGPLNHLHLIRYK